MGAREWFEHIREESEQLDKRKHELDEERATLGPKGQTLGSIGGGGNTDGMADVDALILRGQAYDLDRAKLDAEIEQATDVLYGVSGRGGLASIRGTNDADILCCHYLQGMTYAEIAKRLMDDERCAHLCTVRAMRALVYIDRVGIVYLSQI